MFVCVLVLLTLWGLTYFGHRGGPHSVKLDHVSRQQMYISAMSVKAMVSKFSVSFSLEAPTCGGDYRRVFKPHFLCDVSRLACFEV